MTNDIKEIFEKRKLVMTLAKSDFRKKFIGSYFGIIWMFIQPIVTVLIYYFVFQVAMKARPATDSPYVIWLIPGIVPWFYFNEALMAGTNSLYDYQHLVKKMVFNVSILPSVKILSSMFVHCIFIWIMLIVFLMSGQTPSLWWLQMLYYSGCTTFLLLGLVYFTASVNVVFKDMGQLVNIFLQFGFWLAPIMWDFSMLPSRLHKFFKLNPFYYIVQGFRDSFVFKVGFWEKPLLTIYFWIVSITIFCIGTIMFKRLKPHFADVL
ncbi:teichoic acid ABC transporter permease [Lachnotalea glycerini]|nr:teichoic acid ABC transporter permease [Lachnotalea glycerini]